MITGTEYEIIGHLFILCFGLMLCVISAYHLPGHYRYYKADHPYFSEQRAANALLGFVGGLMMVFGGLLGVVRLWPF